tara:strand:+ start:203 stop:1138 length:936 start_codon:yes stop_codon:yes gene_type:complete
MTPREITTKNENTHPQTENTHAQNSSLMAAANHGSLNCLTNSLNNHSNDINTQNAYGSTALHFAVQANDPTKVALLLEHGADPNITTADGSTALHLATRVDSADITTLLLDHGANPENHEKIGVSAFKIALHLGHLAPAAVLFQAHTSHHSSAKTVLAYIALMQAKRIPDASIIAMLPETLADFKDKAIQKVIYKRIRSLCDVTTQNQHIDQATNHRSVYGHLLRLVNPHAKHSHARSSLEKIITLRKKQQRIKPGRTNESNVAPRLEFDYEPLRQQIFSLFSEDNQLRTRNNSPDSNLSPCVQYITPGYK